MNKMKRRLFIRLVPLAAAWAAQAGCDGGLALSGSDDGYSIHLYRFTGPDHVRRAAKARDAAERLAGWKDVFIVHERAASTVYRGRYSSRASASRDLEASQRWRTPARNRPFQFAYIVPYPAADPGNPQWDLKRAKGAYTVLVEVYFNDRLTKFRHRKRIAARRCEELRAKGEEAYYYHGPANSLVTIGLFDESAVKMTRKKIRGGTEEVVESVSPEMRRVLKRHPYLYRNGRRTEILVANLETGKPEWIDRPAYPVRVPGGGAGRWGGPLTDSGGGPGRRP